MARWVVALAVAWVAQDGAVSALAQDAAAAEASAGEARGPALWGRYACQGRSAEGLPTYTGEVFVVPVGEVYLVIWDIGGSYHVGQGVERGGHLAVAYMNEAKSGHGVALYQRRGDDWDGVWAGSSSGSVAGEVWRR